jgi:hypothetical protein
MQSPIALGQLQIMTDQALAVNAQFHLECSVVSASMLKGKFKVQRYSSNIALAFGTIQDCW